MGSGDFKQLEALRAKGLRVTPQRRAILGAFQGGPMEHLSADVVHALASLVLPELSRATVYATLAELTDIGILSAVGYPDPVRYELNDPGHNHFRCRVCLRLHNITTGSPVMEDLADQGFEVDRVTLIAEGTCAQCSAYAQGLERGARRLQTRGELDRLMSRSDLSGAVQKSPLGPIGICASRKGIVRVAFEEHADLPAIRELAARRGGDRRARGHLRAIQQSIEAYLKGESHSVDAQVDLGDRTEDGARILGAVRAVPYAELRSYSDLELQPTVSAHAVGEILGANPIPLIFPCHRVIRGREIPSAYVGGSRRRRQLIDLERARRQTTIPNRRRSSTQKA
jgi:O-6-methylguanine DNA methyltransferase